MRQKSPHNTKVYNLLLLKKDGVDALIERYPPLMGAFWREGVYFSQVLQCIIDAMRDERRELSHCK